MGKKYQICQKTIMDTSDPNISFDAQGISNHVNDFEVLVKRRIPNSKFVQSLLIKKIQAIKRAGEGKEYDCIIGVSGGVDSTYTAYVVKNLGLRPLAVHLDNGWNSELSVSNIEKVLRTLGIDLYTYVLDWEEFKDLQLSFLKASTPDGEVPTDHAIWGCLYKIANKYDIKYIISGTNVKTEGILAKSWAQGHLDWKYLKNIHRLFGSTKLQTFPSLTFIKLFYYIVLRRINKFNLLDYIEYNKSEAMRLLTNELGWIYYGGKHYESIYTRFFQGYILPKKFNIDKRRGHLSTLICTGEITRNEALELISKDPYPNEQLKIEDKEYVIKKLGITNEEFETIMKSPIKKYEDYPNNSSFMLKLSKLYNKFFYS